MTRPQGTKTDSFLATLQMTQTSSSTVTCTEVAVAIGILFGSLINKGTLISMLLIIMAALHFMMHVTGDN